MKKIIVCLVAVLLVASLAACSLSKPKEKELPEDVVFESQISTEGVSVPITKIRHYSELGFSLEYSEEFERYYSDDSILIKWNDSTFTITKYPGKDMESVKNELIGNILNVDEDSLEINGKNIHRAYFESNRMCEIYFFIENGDATYAVKMYLSLEAMEGLGAHFYDILYSIKFY